MSNLKIIIISGLSGSGKSFAIKCFEDMGFFCVDNMPTALVPKFAELSAQSDRGYARVALGLDIREPGFIDNFGRLCDEMEATGYSLEVLFLEASDEVLARRFSETRRPHPLAKDTPLLEAVSLERAMLEGVKARSDTVIDTSGLSVHQLRDALAKKYGTGGAGRGMTTSVMSFGFKHGLPYEADLVFDVRFLPNPNFAPGLKELTGLDRPVQDFLKARQETSGFMRKLTGLLDFLLPLYEREGKTYLTIAVGCTGGRHRSVAVAEFLRKRMKARGNDILVRHKDIDK